MCFWGNSCNTRTSGHLKIDVEKYILCTPVFKPFQLITRIKHSQKCVCTTSCHGLLLDEKLGNIECDDSDIGTFQIVRASMMISSPYYLILWIVVTTPTCFVMLFKVSGIEIWELLYFKCYMMTTQKAESEKTFWFHWWQNLPRLVFRSKSDGTFLLWLLCDGMSYGKTPLKIDAPH